MKKMLVAFFGIFAFAVSCMAQNNDLKQAAPPDQVSDLNLDSNNGSDTVYTMVDEPPKYEGGEDGLRQFISKTVSYPSKAQKNKIEGRVYVRFCVCKTGTVNKISVLRGVDPLLDSASVDAIRKLAKWIPGKKNGINVNVWYTVPINFKLQ